MRFIWLLLIPTLVFGQEFGSGPLTGTIKGPYDISGDSTLSVDHQWINNLNTVKLSGYFEVYLLVDSLDGDGTFTSSDTSDLELKPRVRIGYDVADDARDLTWYTTINDSVTVFTDATLTVGVRNWDFGLDECDGVEIEHNFEPGDTLRVWYYFKHSGQP